MSKILVVDDEKNIRTLYEAELTEEGYEVLIAASASDTHLILLLHLRNDQYSLKLVQD